MTIFPTNWKNPVFDPFFFSILGQKKKNFPENLALSRTNSYGFLAPCKISEKTNDTIPRKCLDRMTDGRTEGLTDPILWDPSGYCRGSNNKFNIKITTKI